MTSSIPQVAVVGTGYWGKNLVRNYHALGALRLVCDKNPETLKHFKETYPGVRGALSVTDILSDQEIDGVVVATPAETHAQLVRECLLAGKDVYVEKPLCLSTQDGRDLAELAHSKDRILMVGHLLWYHPVVRKLKELITEGELGRILYIYSNRLNMGKLRREENVLWSFAPHDISLILGLIEERPNKVQAQGGNYLHSEIADATVSTLAFPSGVRAHLFVSWLHPFKEQKLVVVGQKKMAVFDDTAPWPTKLQLYAHSVEWPDNVPVALKAEAESIEVEEQEPLRLECQQFLDSIQTRQPPITDAAEGVRVLEVLNACQTALEEGCGVGLHQDVETEKSAYFAHKSAVVDDGVTIGQGVKIWHFSHILPETTIGKNVNIGQNVVIGPRVVVGDGCKIQNNVSIYEGITLEENVFCGPSMVFTNVFNPRCHIRRMKELRKTVVKKGATIGANATIVCGNTIGEYAFVGAGAVVTEDIPPHGMYVGNPAVFKGWMCTCGVRLYDDLSCPECGSGYEMGDNGLSRKLDERNEAS